MAESPAHRFGQVVGNLLEEILQPQIAAFCDERGLYLDRHGSRVGVRTGKKVSWEDRYGNSHDLDFVIKKDGSPDRRGRPVAFIEAAWRRYTKHSRNKAQEIQGAILPIAEKYGWETPFLGAVLAGQFTAPSLKQLRSLGFEVVFMPYETIVAAFRSVEIDARFDEDTPPAAFTACVDRIEGLPKLARTTVKESIVAANRAEIERFFATLRRKLDRTVEQVIIMPLFGSQSIFGSIAEAADFLEFFDQSEGAGEFYKFEVAVTFSNRDEVRGTFSDNEEAVRFLRYVTA